MSDASTPFTLEQSHGRARVTLREVPPLPPPPPTLARRKRASRKAAKGITTLNPAQAAPWIAPHIPAAAAHGVELAQRYDDPILFALCGAAADALAMFRGLVTLAASGDEKARAEARGWLREFRSCSDDLAALAATTKPKRDRYDPNDPLGLYLIADEENARAAARRANANSPGVAGRDFYDCTTHEHDHAPAAPTDTNDEL